MNSMPPLPGDIREAILFRLQDIQRVLAEAEQLLCVDEDEEQGEEK